MPRGHHIAKCLHCLKEWVVGDCVPSICPECEDTGHTGLGLDCPKCNNGHNERMIASYRKEIDRLKESGEIATLIAQLTMEEGSILTIPSPNADFGGPAMFVEVSPGLCNFTRRFNGESLLDCLRKAAKEIF